MKIPRSNDEFGSIFPYPNTTMYCKLEQRNNPILFLRNGKFYDSPQFKEVKCSDLKSNASSNFGRVVKQWAIDYISFKNTFYTTTWQNVIYILLSNLWEKIDVFWILKILYTSLHIHPCSGFPSTYQNNHTFHNKGLSADSLLIDQQGSHKDVMVMIFLKYWHSTPHIKSYW